MSSRAQVSSRASPVCRCRLIMADKVQAYRTVMMGLPAAWAFVTMVCSRSTPTCRSSSRRWRNATPSPSARTSAGASRPRLIKSKDFRGRGLRGSGEKWREFLPDDAADMRGVRGGEERAQRHRDPPANVVRGAGKILLAVARSRPWADSGERGKLRRVRGTGLAVLASKLAISPGVRGEPDATCQRPLLEGERLGVGRQEKI